MSLVSYDTGYCAVIYVDMRNAKLSCCKIFGIVYFGFAWDTDTGAFAIVKKICLLYECVQDHVVPHLEVKSTECLTV